MSRSRHSSLAERIHLSANAFRFGLRAGKARGFTPASFNTARNVLQYFVSRSMISNLLSRSGGAAGLRGSTARLSESDLFKRTSPRIANQVRFSFPGDYGSNGPTSQRPLVKPEFGRSEAGRRSERRVRLCMWKANSRQSRSCAEGDGALKKSPQRGDVRANGPVLGRVCDEPSWTHGWH